MKSVEEVAAMLELVAAPPRELSASTWAGRHGQVPDYTVHTAARDRGRLAVPHRSLTKPVSNQGTPFQNDTTSKLNSSHGITVPPRFGCLQPPARLLAKQGTLSGVPARQTQHHLVLGPMISATAT